MKTLILSTLLLGITFAQTAPEPARNRGEGKKAKFIARFDSDGDGQLSQEEREEALDALLEERPKLAKRLDTNQDGTVDAEERKSAFQKFEAARNRKRQQVDQN